ncbi:hypothetical protein [Massilia sp. erpn]|uniref:hypothetical protein n=1 Tax=Massilia sp. erpn TaxID=2738142 RepID=UPI002107DDC2|nr:hypothetical protein [Massilia sp. erpn]UTY60254.1 hypothetical protein HPQ68_25535 [Massilia sp. erpn]
MYFIDGTRGAGKSTFLRSAYEGLTEAGASLASLSYIDPSRIENNEIILLDVLKELARMLDVRVQATSTLAKEPEYLEFRALFKKLAGGLSLFAKDHHQLQHLDPELFLDHGLERAGHSKDLRKNLHAVFDKACRILKVRALVLAFDDADTKATHAQAVLECIRNYLDTPQLVVLVTGDMELYSLVVRDHFFDNIGRNQGSQDEARRQQRTRMVDHLEDQYLLKLFPIRRRLQLRPLWNLLERPAMIDGRKIQYRLTCRAWQAHPNRSPDIVIEELLRRGLRIKERSDIVLYREFLLKQPMRSVLQVLSRCAPYLSAQTPDQAQTSYTWDDSLSEALRESLRAMALGSLYKYGVDVDAIAAHELPALIDAVFELANRDGDPDTAAYLRPQPNNESLKVCFPALAADVAGLCAMNSASLIQFMLAGPGSVSLWGNVLRRNGGKIARDVLQTQFKQYMGTGCKEDALNWARHATALIAAPHKPSPSRSLVGLGIIGLNKERPDAAGQAKEKYAERDYQTIFRAIQDCAHLPVCALSLIEVSGTSNRSYASIFNILGLIGRLLQHRDAKKVLMKPYPPLSISCPEWEGGGTNLVDDTDSFDEAPAGLPDGLEGQQQAVAPAAPEDAAAHGEEGEAGADEAAAGEGKVKSLSADCMRATELWIAQVDELTITPSSVLLGKIWTRLYYSLEKAADALRPSPSKDHGPASLMQMFALCVVNAFLVEEADHHLSGNMPGSLPAIDRNNPLTTPNPFLEEKLGIILQNPKLLPLTHLVATCPLILGLIRGTPQCKTVLQGFCFEAQEQTAIEYASLLCDEDSWRLIEHSFIAGRWKNEKKESGKKGAAKP